MAPLYPFWFNSGCLLGHRGRQLLQLVAHAAAMLSTWRFVGYFACWQEQAREGEEQKPITIEERGSQEARAATATTSMEEAWQQKEAQEAEAQEERGERPFKDQAGSKIESNQVTQQGQQALQADSGQEQGKAGLHCWGRDCYSDTAGFELQRAARAGCWDDDVEAAVAAQHGYETGEEGEG